MFVKYILTYAILQIYNISQNYKPSWGTRSLLNARRDTGDFLFFSTFFSIIEFKYSRVCTFYLHSNIRFSMLLNSWVYS